MPQTLSIMVVLLVAGTAAASAPQIELQPSYSQVDSLKRRYLDCEVAAQSGSLDGAGIAACSVIYEDLKRVAFDGSFHDLRAWYDGLRAFGLAGHLPVRQAN
ncbi:MAG: hypothetical protein AAFX45_10540 [Pseudomonadota bacterium]